MPPAFYRVPVFVGFVVVSVLFECTPHGPSPAWPISEAMILLTPFSKSLADTFEQATNKAPGAGSP
jgi:hypothetical protein